MPIDAVHHTLLLHRTAIRYNYCISRARFGRVRPWPQMPEDTRLQTANAFQNPPLLPQSSTSLDAMHCIRQLTVASVVYNIQMNVSSESRDGN